MTSVSRMSELAAIVAESTAKLEQGFKENGLPLPSFGLDMPGKLQLPMDLELIRHALLNTTAELHELLLGPQEHLQSLDQSSNNLVSLHAVYHYKIAEALPIGEEATFEHISQRCGLNEPDVRRLLRLAMSYHVFHEPRKGVVAHTAASKLLAEDSLMKDWLGSLCEEIWPAAVNTIPAMKKWPNSQEPQHSGFSLANNTELSMYPELAKHPERARRFAASMSMYTSGPGFSSAYVLEAIPWNSFGDGLVVDMGGSHGDMMMAIARRTPSLKFVVQDLPSVIESRPATPLDLKDRITFMGHDFFVEQPVKNADVYFVRWVFHGWSDKYCLLLLKNLIPALKPGARIIINDFSLPDPGILPLLLERRIRIMDIAQLDIQNSREREYQEYVELFAQADERFKVLELKQPQGSVLAFIEAVWEEGPKA